MQDICGAKTRSGKQCQNAPMANGRCRMHGGIRPAGVDHPNYQHGRYSKYAPTSISEKIDDYKLGNVLDLADELATQRALFSEYLERFKITKPDLTSINLMMSWLTDISKTVERIIKIQNETALTATEIKFLQVRIVDLVMKYIPETQHQEAFVNELFGNADTSTKFGQFSDRRLVDAENTAE